ncbi:alanine racemase [Pedobacter sp. SD-b]|uniref:Alanine racemase n=1 Tax=Pedobacter segetis TaxID=2793069 RepID=A0ABS1BIR2_9SPHI|nr:alanine racemase [Pedobacter segetis]MBK0382773.1 alanine racemase [Pedobacter segetis]
MFETSALSISSSAYQNNIAFIKKRCGDGVRFCSVVKGNAYGHGLVPFVKMAYQNGVDYFAVYSSAEAFEIKNALPNADLIIMGMTDENSLNWAISNAVEFFIFDFEKLKLALKIASQLNKKAKIHIEVETGMNRTGFLISELTEVFNFIKQHSNFIELTGFATHYAGAESLVNDFRVREQINLFTEAQNLLLQSALKPKYIHSACSAAMMNYPETISNMVRIGIMQYGFWPNEETLIRYNGNSRENDGTLNRLMSWSSKVMTLKRIKKGDYVGYNTSFQAYADMTLAVIPVGYAYGYSRSLSNSGKVLIRGEEAPICGIVNMNALCVDVSHIDDVKINDDVILIGSQAGKTISVASFGNMSDQLNYELLTRLPYDIPRTILD